MEDHKDELILILAGYHQEMDAFLQTNPGLHSRFPLHLHFPDYSQSELLQIAEGFCTQRQYKLSPGARQALLRHFTTARPLPNQSFGNARTVRNLIEQALRRQAVRLLNRPVFTREDLMLLETGDMPEVEL